MEKSKEDTIQDLKDTLLKDILLQEKVRVLYTKILRRISLIYGATGFLIVMGIFSIIYFLFRPPVANPITIKSVQAMYDATLINRRFNAMDRQDITVARQQLVELLKPLDSAKRVQDSIFYDAVKKLSK